MAKIQDTSIFNNITKEINEKGWIWDFSLSKDLPRFMFGGIAQYLGHVKSKKVVQGITISNIEGTFGLGAFAQYIPSPDDDESKGAFHLVFTFNEDDMKTEDPNWKVVDMTDPVARAIITNVGIKDVGIRLEPHEGQDILRGVFYIGANNIKEYLRQNPTEAELEINGLLKIQTTVEEDGKTIYSITPSEELKQFMKEDEKKEKK